jgi:glycosyltransferase involved in cell wall biosynthesis
VILTFAYPGSEQRTGGVATLYEFASALARRGHEVHIFHGDAPAPSWFAFDERIVHHSAPSIDDPSLPAGDVIFAVTAPERLGLPVGIVQGYRMIDPGLEHQLITAPCPKMCVARWLIDVATDLGVPPEQLWHTPYGIDHDLFAPRIPQDRRTIDVAMLYHAHPEKGWGVAVAAVEEVRRRRPDLRVVAFGMIPPSVPEAYGLKRPSEPLPEWAEFVTAPSHRQLADEVYNATRVFLQPSFHEGFGLPALESMACGAALVSTDNGGSQDYALPGETALVAPPGDAAGLADAIDELLGDDALRARLTEAGSRHALRFDWDRTAAELEGHLERYVADPARYRRSASDAAAAGIE